MAAAGMGRMRDCAVLAAGSSPLLPRSFCCLSSPSASVATRSHGVRRLRQHAHRQADAGAARARLPEQRAQAASSCRSVAAAKRSERNAGNSRTSRQQEGESRNTSEQVTATITTTIAAPAFDRLPDCSAGLHVRPFDRSLVLLVSCRCLSHCCCCCVSCPGLRTEDLIRVGEMGSVGKQAVALMPEHAQQARLRRIIVRSHTTRPSDSRARSTTNQSKPAVHDEEERERTSSDTTNSHERGHAGRSTAADSLAASPLRCCLSLCVCSCVFSSAPRTCATSTFICLMPLRSCSSPRSRSCGPSSSTCSSASSSARRTSKCDNQQQPDSDTRSWQSERRDSRDRDL